MNSKAVMVSVVVVALMALGARFFSLRLRDRDTSSTHDRAIPDSSAALLASPPSPDDSLTEDQYRAFGFPTTDHNWGLNEMSVAGMKISELTAKNAGQLPMFRSSKSGRIFAKIVDPESLGLHQPETLPVQTRFDRLAATYTALCYIVGGYAKTAQNHAGYDESAVEVTGALLRVLKAMQEQGQQILATTPKDDVNYSSRAAGYEKMGDSISLFTLAAVGGLAEPGPRPMSVPTLRRLLQHCNESVPDIMAPLTARQRLGTMMMLRHGTFSPDPEIQKGFTLLREKVKFSVSISTP